MTIRVANATMYVHVIIIIKNNIHRANEYIFITHHIYSIYSMHQISFRFIYRDEFHHHQYFF
jgi:hypothetical protein